jgi:hypothetical protein
VQAANFSILFAPVYQRNHGLLPHGSNTLLHSTNQPRHIISGPAVWPGSPADAAMLAGAVLARAAGSFKIGRAGKFMAMRRVAVAVGHRMLFACRLMELEATPGIEPGYTVLQTVA